MNNISVYIKEAIEINDQHFCEMANITKKRSKLKVDIFSDHAGILRNNTHKEPRVKLSNSELQISISIEKNPRILACSNNVSKEKILRVFKDGIAFVGRNYDIFLKHYMDINDSFDDEDMFNALRKRGEYE